MFRYVRQVKIETSCSGSVKEKNCGTRQKTKDGFPEISKMNFRNRIPEPDTTIYGFADS
jgi:hypothetical protein